MRSERFDRAVSSDLSRAFETARIIRGKAPVERDPRWREFAFGEWEGLTWEEIAARSPELAGREITAATRYEPPGGESFAAVRERVAQALADLERARYESVLIVTHAGPLHAMLHTFFGHREAEMQEVLGVRFVPACITQVEVIAGAADLLTLNEAAHLRFTAL